MNRKAAEITIGAVCIIAGVSWLLGVATRGGIHYRENRTVIICGVESNRVSVVNSTTGGGTVGIPKEP